MKEQMERFCLVLTERLNKNVSFKPEVLPYEFNPVVNFRISIGIIPTKILINEKEVLNWGVEVDSFDESIERTISNLK